MWVIWQDGIWGFDRFSGKMHVGGRVLGEEWWYTFMVGFNTPEIWTAVKEESAYKWM